MEEINVQQLYANLLALSDGTNSESFFCKEVERDGWVYHIFGYHIASYTDFCHEGALSGRGIMFSLGVRENGKTAPGGSLRIASFPPDKFFNLFENPFTIGLDPKGFTQAMNKEDGSLISTYLHNGALAVKSKTSLDSDQVKLAEAFLNNTDTGKLLKLKLDVLTKRGYTVNCELVSPQNRIVLAYPTTTLVVLNVRCNKTSQTFFQGDHQDIDRILGIDWVESINIPDGTQEDFIKSVEDMEGIEGFVLKHRTAKGIQLVKYKTKWYQHLHHNKDSIAIPRRLFECIIDEVADDLKAMFHDDPLSMKTITDMEEKVLPIFSHMIHMVESFHEANKGLTRKDYAIKGQKELGNYFGLGMGLYLGKPSDYKEFAKKHPELFGVKQELVKEVVSE